MQTYEKKFIKWLKCILSIHCYKTGVITKAVKVEQALVDYKLQCSNRNLTICPS